MRSTSKISLLATLGAMAWGSLAWADQGTISIQYNAASGGVAVANRSNCKLTGVGVTFLADLVSKSKFKRERSIGGPTEVTVTWVWGSEYIAADAQEFVLGRGNDNDVLPSGFRANSIDLLGATVFEGNTALHSKVTEFSKLHDGVRMNPNWVASFDGESWDDPSMSQFAVGGHWAVEPERAQLNVEGCKDV